MKYERAAMLVMKFGGSSVADRAQIAKVQAIVQGRLSRKPVVVCSAHKGITDALIHAAREAAAGRYDPERIVARQRAIAAELACDSQLLDPLFREISDLLRGILLVKELSPRSLDYISSFGERMSVRCIADFFSRHGLRAQAHDVWDLGFVTDSEFGQARPVTDFEERARAAFDALPTGVVPIVTGFIGKNEAGEVTTVGRNGSDLTATLLAAALGAEEVEIWTDTDGVMTADPSVVNGARNIPHMRFDEAAELAYFGSRVLHPSTLLPAMQKRIPVRVLNTNQPDLAGTVIHEAGPANPNSITSIAYKENQLVLTFSATHMFGEGGFLSKVFEICARQGVVVDMVSTSEVTLSLTANARAPVERAAAELRALGDLEIHTGRTILAVVGQHLAERPGLGADILRAVANAGVNVEMVSYAFGAINFSMVIADADIGPAVSTLHRMLFEA
ncbi:MAG TPA: aspartate kinase [Polyangiaceae bacterium]|nr:aspartate kinase [Polyangiaceae bacterium]